jgi:O-antigen biosynthesis protein
MALGRLIIVMQDVVQHGNTDLTSIVGYLDAIGGPEIIGWVYDKARPGQALSISVQIDGQVILSTSADVHRPDVTSGGYHFPNVGFHILVPARFHDGAEHSVEFIDSDNNSLTLRDAINGSSSQSWRVSFGRPDLDGSSSASFDAGSIVAHIDDLNERGISGWAYDEAAPLEPTTLCFHIDGDHFADVVCDGIRRDVKKSGHPSHLVGFSRPIPLRYFDGEPHKVECRSRNGRSVNALTRGHEVLEFNFPPVVIMGRVDGLRDGALRGWALRLDRDTGCLHGGLQVLVSMQGHPVAQLTARSSRADVAKAHDCDPCCGFTYCPPAQLVAGRIVEFDFRVIPGGHMLTGSPVRVNFPSLETAAAIRDLQEDIDKIFAELWLLRDRVRRMAPRPTHTVEHYDPWARQYQKALAVAPDRLKGLLPADSPPPLVTIVCPAYKPRLPDFVAAVESVRAQTYPHWELIIVDDASKSTELTRCIAALKERDKRIKAVTLRANRGISASTNAGLTRAKGRYVAFLDHDDLLAERAIEFMLAAALRSGAQMLYSDEDKIDDEGIFSEPNFKPDWNYRLLLAQNYVCHLLLVERTQLIKVGPLRTECDGAQDHDIIIRLSEVIQHDRIEHVPEVLYHWRKTAASTAASGGSKMYAVAAGVRAIQDHLDRRGLAGRAHSPRAVTCFEIDWEITREPAINIIIPYREHIDMTRACLEALHRNTDYANYQTLLVDNWSVSDEALAFVGEIENRWGISVLRVEEPFNYSRLNNLAVAASSGELLLFMNNDVFVSNPAWLRAMVGEMLADPRVGIVGNKLLYPSGLVQHGGVILGVGGVADHAHRGLPADHPGYVGRAICAQDMSAVTAACMLCRRDVFEAVGGFDEAELQVAFNDVDLCLKVGREGYRVIWTPSSVAEHRESMSRFDDMRSDQQPRFFHENEVMKRRWEGILSHDRFYNRAFSRLSGICTDLGPASVMDVNFERADDPGSGKLSCAYPCATAPEPAVLENMSAKLALEHDAGPNGPTVGAPGQKNPPRG